MFNNLHILYPFNLNFLNLIKPRGLKSIIVTGFLNKLNYINEIRIAFIFKNDGLIGPEFGMKNINAMN